MGGNSVFSSIIGTPCEDHDSSYDMRKVRLHGAFTGGFSSGYFNTVGSKEGWEPTTYKSGRDHRADTVRMTAAEMMDEEDIGTFFDTNFTMNEDYALNSPHVRLALRRSGILSTSETYILPKALSCEEVACKDTTYDCSEKNVILNDTQSFLLESFENIPRFNGSIRPGPSTLSNATAMPLLGPEDAKSALSGFMPFLTADLEKHRRYVNFLLLASSGKGAACAGEETREFVMAALMYRPLSGGLSASFKTSDPRTRENPPAAVDLPRKREKFLWEPGQFIKSQFS